MPTEKEVYESHADEYERLIAREDFQDNLPKQIREIRDTEGLDVVEFGAGTGRLTREIFKTANSLRACDASHHMLRKARELIGPFDNQQLILSVADMRQTPFPSHSADIVLAGWSFCYLAVWGGKNWQSSVEAGIAEAKRLLRQDGTLILLESFGTGTEEPAPPQHLIDYLHFLTDLGFQSHWFRTDYQFESIAEALELSGFFFGEEMTEKIRLNKWEVLPECTAIYWKKFT